MDLHGSGGSLSGCQPRIDFIEPVCLCVFAQQGSAPFLLLLNDLDLTLFSCSRAPQKDPEVRWGGGETLRGVKWSEVGVRLRSCGVIVKLI